MNINVTGSVCEGLNVLSFIFVFEVLIGKLVYIPAMALFLSQACTSSWGDRVPKQNSKVSTHKLSTTLLHKTHSNNV